MIEKLYTVEEVAELASVTGRTIRNYLKSGRLVGRKIGGQWRFPETEVQRLLTGAEDAGFAEEDSAEEPAPSLPPEPRPAISLAPPAPSTEETQPPFRPGNGYVPPAPLPSPAAPSFEAAASSARPASQGFGSGAAETATPHEALTPRPLAPYAPPSASAPCEKPDYCAPYSHQEPEPEFVEPEWPSAAVSHEPPPAPPPLRNTETTPMPQVSAPSSASYSQAVQHQPISAAPVRHAPVPQPQNYPAQPASSKMETFSAPTPQPQPSYSATQPSYQAPPPAQPEPVLPPQRQAEPVSSAGAEYPLYASYAPPAQPAQNPANGYQPLPYQAMGFPSGYGFPLYGQAMQQPVYPAGMQGYYPAGYPAPQPAAETQKADEPPKPAEPAPSATAAKSEPDGSYPPPAQKPALPDEPSLSEVGKRVTRFISEVHDCSAGPLICSVVDLYQSLAAAKTTSERLAEIARQESENGVLCQSFVEYDERYYVARYTLLGSSAFLFRCLKLIG